MKNISKLLLLLLFISCSKAQRPILFTGDGITPRGGFHQPKLEEGKITFPVCKDIERAEKLAFETPSETILLQIANRKNEMLFDRENIPPTPVVLSSSVTDSTFIPSRNNAFADAVYLAYAQHRPLVISPDMIWLLIAQGFALHVEENAEDLRYIFVDHEGQMNLDVKRTSYQPHSRGWWEGIFPDFSRLIAANTKEDVYKFVAPTFSTTTMVEKAAFEITLMDAMSPYFTYSVSIICGIPEITLEGKPEDWDLIYQKLEMLDTFKLEWWADDLKKIVSEFQKASRGEVNQKFWKGIFSVQQVSVGCGSKPAYLGWMFDLFPYFKTGLDKEGNTIYIKNQNLQPNVDEPIVPSIESSFSVDMGMIPSGIARAKVLLNEGPKMTMLNFNAGFIGTTQDKETIALRPSIQWFVTDLGIPPTEAELKKYQESFQ